MSITLNVSIRKAIAYNVFQCYRLIDFFDSRYSSCPTSASTFDYQKSWDMTCNPKWPKVGVGRWGYHNISVNREICVWTEWSITICPAAIDILELSYCMANLDYLTWILSPLLKTAGSGNVATGREMMWAFKNVEVLILSFIVGVVVGGWESDNTVEPQLENIKF